MCHPFPVRCRYFRRAPTSPPPLLRRQRVPISAAFADSDDFDAFGSNLISGGVLHRSALSGIQAELEFRHIAAFLANDMMMTCFINDGLEMCMLFVESVVLYKTLGFEER